MKQIARSLLFPSLVLLAAMATAQVTVFSGSGRSQVNGGDALAARAATASLGLEHKLSLLFDPAVFLNARSIDDSTQELRNGTVVDGWSNTNVTERAGFIEKGFHLTASQDLNFQGGVHDAFVASVANSPTQGAKYYTVFPCRVADTRNPPGPSGGPALAAGATRTFQVANICGVPSSAKAVFINMVVVLPSDFGDLRVYPAGQTAPLASFINFRPGVTRANNGIVGLGDGGQISVQCDMASGSTNLLFDVYGYFQLCSSINPTTQSFGSGGGPGTVNVTATVGCPWTATSNNNWITINSGGNGSGNGTVSYSVAANASPIQRAGTITIAGQTFPVTQDANTCISSLSPPGQAFGPGGGSQSVSVIAPGGCAWTAESNDLWIMVTSGDTGTGNGAVSYTVDANDAIDSNPRTGTLTIAGDYFTVTQGGTCAYAVSPTTSGLFLPSGGSDIVSVTTGAACRWTATTTEGWITIAPITSSTGSGSVTYSVAENTGDGTRQGTMTIAGQPVTVVQAGTQTAPRIDSIERLTYNSPLIDALPPTSFPRGGTYFAVVRGSGLSAATAFLTGDPDVTGILSSASDTEITVMITSTSVGEDQTLQAPILGLGFSIILGDQPFDSGSVTLDIVAGFAPSVTNFEVTNGVTTISRGVPTTVTFSVTILDSGNVTFFYVGCGNCSLSQTQFGPFAGTQFETSFTFTEIATIPADSTATSWLVITGAVDGAGQGGVNQNGFASLSIPVQ